MEPNQVHPRAWHQRRQSLHELQRRHDQVRGAIAPSCLELEHHLPGGVGLHAFVGQCRASDVAAQLFQRLPVVGAAAHSGVQAEPVDVSAWRLLEFFFPWHRALHRQHPLAGARTEGEAVGTGRQPEAA